MSAYHGHLSWPTAAAGGQAAAGAQAAVGQAMVGQAAVQAGQLISLQSLQQMASKCAAFKPLAGTPRIVKAKQPRCSLQPHVVRGLMELSAMLGATCSKAHSDFRLGRQHTEGDQVLHTPFLKARAAAPSLCFTLLCARTRQSAAG